MEKSTDFFSWLNDTIKGVKNEENNELTKKDKVRNKKIYLYKVKAKTSFEVIEIRFKSFNNDIEKPFQISNLEGFCVIILKIF